METLTQCPSCQSESFVPFLEATDYTVSQERFAIHQCQTCSLRFTNPRPTAEEIGAYYQSTAYASHSDTRRGLVNKLYGLVRNFTLDRKLRLINQYHQPGRLLDIGCGTGSFLRKGQQAGWQVQGVEPDPGARKRAAEKVKQVIFSQVLEVPTDAFFDIITMWHVLEHVHALQATVEQLKNWLHAESTLLIAVPNSDSWDCQHYGTHWAAWDVPRHLYHFNPTSLEMLLNSKGLRVIEKLPVPFDSYYISLLSHKYAQGTTDYLHMLRQGWRSNWWAQKHQNNYSSLIYVVKK